MPVLNSFGGIIPRLSWHALPETAATVAHNVKLRNKRLEPWREKKALNMVSSDVLSFHYSGCCPMFFNSCVSVADYLPDHAQVYVTGRSDRPEVAIFNGCEVTYQYLGVPKPSQPLSISAAESYSEELCDSRSYVYTYINNFGEESAPSLPSRDITVDNGTPVTITNIQQPPPGWGIEAIAIYRTATGYRSGAEKEQVPVTDYMRCAILEPIPTSYVDTNTIKNPGPVVSTREGRIPPADLRHISHVKKTGTLVGVTNNKVHFSRDYQPWNWPAAFDITIPYNIVNMVTLDSWVFVSTDSYPFVIDGRNNGELRQCRSVEDVDVPLPDIACGYACSAITSPFGMIYTSKQGLVLVSPDAKFKLITAGWFGRDDWLRMRPETARLAYWDGYIFCVTDNVSFILEIDGETYADAQLGELVTISDKPLDMRTTSAGELLMLEDDRIWHWDGGERFRPYVWESRELSFGGEVSPNSAKIRTNNITFSLLTPVAGLEYTRQVLYDEPFRLKRLGRHLRYRMRFSGTGTVEYADLGTSYTSVNSGG